MNLAAAFQRVDSLGRRRDLIAVKVRPSLLEFGEVFDRLECALRPEEALNVDAAKAGRVDAPAVRLRPDVARQVGRSRSVAVDMAIKACHAAHAIRLFRLPVGGRVELLLRELRDQQAQALEVLGIQDALEDLLEVFDRDNLALGNVTQVGTGRQIDRRRELGQKVIGQVEIKVEALEPRQHFDLGI